METREAEHVALQKRCQELEREVSKLREQRRGGRDQDEVSTNREIVTLNPTLNPNPNPDSDLKAHKIEMRAMREQLEAALEVFECEHLMLI